MWQREEIMDDRRRTQSFAALSTQRPRAYRCPEHENESNTQQQQNDKFYIAGISVIDTGVFLSRKRSRQKLSREEYLHGGVILSTHKAVENSEHER
jgi:hypothetical protein